MLATRSSTQEGSGSANHQASSVQQCTQHVQTSALKAVPSTEHGQEPGLAVPHSRGLSNSMSAVAEQGAERTADSSAKHQKAFVQGCTGQFRP